MYNKYSYDLSNTTMNININSNIADCFEKVSNETENIKDILNNINKKFIENNYEGEGSEGSEGSEDSKSDYTYSKSTYYKPSTSRSTSKSTSKSTSRSTSKYTYSKPTKYTFKR